VFLPDAGARESESEHQANSRCLDGEWKGRGGGGRLSALHTPHGSDQAHNRTMESLSLPFFFPCWPAPALQSVCGVLACWLVCWCIGSVYYGLTNAAKEAAWLRKLLRQLQYSGLDIEPTLIHGDNQSSLALAEDVKSHQRTKHVDIEFHYIRNRSTKTGSLSHI